ncbi:hypothetical protein NDU88_002925 [Pleurodeles waltl]|uniref:Uncharacterized protein n=1 Tax=Pleurodeles waltl TaxID=8319 RepID=A0AAV7W5Y7_PLEWA|nr:hypothetical protein NDU88_002925 [Pleurodeles waltl]
MAQGKGDGVRLGVGRLEWALHPRPAGALTRCPVTASPARGPSGRLADPGLLAPCGGTHPPALTGEGVLRLGRQAAQSRPPNRPCPDRPEFGLDSASAPRQERFSWSFTQGWSRTEKPVGLGGARVLPGLSPPYPGLGVLPLGGCLPPSRSPGERPGGLSPDHPTPSLSTSLPAPGAHFPRLLSPHVVGAYRTLEGRQKLELAGRPGRPAIWSPGRRAIWSPVPATRWPGMTRAGRQASRPLTAAGSALALGGASQGQLASPAALAARGGISRSGHLVAPPTCEGSWDTPRPCTLRRRAGGGRPPCRAARGGGGLPRARACSPSPPARRQRDAGGRPRTETKAWLRG